MTNLPQPQHQPDDNVWARFSVNPHTHPEVRASDTDRDVAAEVMNAAFSDGRLDNLEHADRLSAVLGAKTLGELVPLLSDVTIAARPAVPKTPVAAARDTALRSWLGLAILFNVIWLATWVFAGIGPYYYWPIWPMIGTAIPALIPYFVPDHAAQRDAERRNRQQQREERNRRRQLGR